MATPLVAWRISCRIYDVVQPRGSPGFAGLAHVRAPC